jgi:putative FmdB family regulatory protein
MPTYDYSCGSCRHVFEVFESMNASGLRECPRCSEVKARRLIGTGAGLLFKGSGFYVTDYKKSGGSSSSRS